MLELSVLGATDKLLEQVFITLKPALTKHELRYLMRKLRLPDETMTEIEQLYSGKDKLQDRVFASFK